MKALSVRQPWAWLLTRGPKDVENRTWRTSFRGPLYIHAGKKLDEEALLWLAVERPDLDLPHRSSLHRGGIVGRARMVDCVDEHDSPWFNGPWGFVMREREPVEFRACRGQLGFFEPQFVETPFETTRD